jgi:hypothetical protein
MNLQKAIKLARLKIAEHNLALSEYLDVCIKSGDQFIYIPDDDNPITWSF